LFILSSASECPSTHRKAGILGISGPGSNEMTTRVVEALATREAASGNSVHGDKLEIKMSHTTAAPPTPRLSFCKDTDGGNKLFQITPRHVMTVVPKDLRCFTI